jgi:lipopolysaccharide/colanic/teichoic acid biosynthesis glycosyltransferase
MKEKALSGVGKSAVTSDFLNVRVTPIQWVVLHGILDSLVFAGAGWVVPHAVSSAVLFPFLFLLWNVAVRLYRVPPLNEVQELQRLLVGGVVSGALGSWILGYTILQFLWNLPVFFLAASLAFVGRDWMRSAMGYSPLRQFLHLEGPLRKSNVLTWNYRILKRSVDLLLGIPLALLSFPVILLFSALVKWMDPHGPAIFRQYREGEGGKLFPVFKIRTMYHDAEERLQRHLARHPEFREEWHRHFKLKNDPRILPILGRFLRKSSIDELPQFWNVLRGEMSLVGPRPLPGYHLSRFSPVFRKLRQRAKPGITGLWQVLVRSDGDTLVLQLLDAYYIQNWSMWMDYYILLKTIRLVITGKGAY